MSKAELAQKALQSSVSRFIAEAQEHAKIQLDGSIKSLLGVATVLQQYHTWYERGKAANDPDHMKFAQDMTFLATCYVGDVLTRQFKGEWTTTPDGMLAITIAGTQFPLLMMMADEIKNGKPHSILIVPQIDAVLKKNAPKPEVTADEQLAAKMKSLAEAAVKDVKAMLKADLDFTPASLGLIDQALQRVKSLIEMAPEHRQQMTDASADKYGAYIGEVLLKQSPGKWVCVKHGEQTYRGVTVGDSYATAELIVRAVLEGKSLHLGNKPAATTVVEFYEACRQTAVEAKMKRETTPQYILDNLEMLSNATAEAGKSFGQTLDGTLFSLAGLDEVIAKKREQLQRDAENESKEAAGERRALTAIAYGAYLGETLREVHGGAWEKHPRDPEGESPRIRHRKFLLFPIDACAAFLRGAGVETTGGEVRTVQQYYQDVRPMLQDEMTKRLLGSAADWDALMASLGTNQEVNRQVLEFAESCVLETRAQHGIVLDFSEESLREVDEILKKIHDLPEDKKKDNGHFDPLNLVYWYGCYAGEVFRRVLGGAWTNEAYGNPPQNVLRLFVEGSQIFVLNKVQKALKDPVGDSLAFMLFATKKALEEQRTKIAGAGRGQQK